MGDPFGFVRHGRELPARLRSQLVFPVDLGRGRTDKS